MIPILIILSSTHFCPITNTEGYTIGVPKVNTTVVKVVGISLGTPIVLLL